MVADSDLLEGASFVPKAPSEEKLREAKLERMEESLEPIADDQAEGSSE
ncbi:hypothetical protein PNQ29_09735 [Halobacterium salinarum]|nr:hypothetical protein [Halobacterium salinarum]MDL0120008.1 hypothetical protein [Halobacterium salinarum]